MPLYLTERDVESLFEPGDAVPIVEDSFRRLAAGDVVNQPRLRLPLDGGALALMGAVDNGLGLAGVKTYAAAFVVVLFDAQDGRCVGVIEANVLGQLRTGAASGVAAKHLAREGATRLGILGCGFQAETQVACIRAAVPTIEHVVAFCRTESNLEEFCARVGAEPAETHREACVDSDVVVAATTSKDPVLRGEWLQAGALVCAMGANHPSRRELDDVVLERATFVCCDSREQARLESGDLIEPVANGVLDWLEVYELQDVVAGRGAGSADAGRHRRVQVERARGLGCCDRRRGTGACARARRRHRALASRQRAAGRLDRVVADSANDVRAIEEPGLLRRRETIAHVRVVEDVLERPSALVLADDVGGDSILLRGTREEERERIAKDVGQPAHAGRILAECAGARKLAALPSAS